MTNQNVAKGGHLLSITYYDPFGMAAWRGSYKGGMNCAALTMGYLLCLVVWVKSNAWLRHGYTFAIDWGFEQLFAPSRICSVN